MCWERKPYPIKNLDLGLICRNKSNYMEIFLKALVKISSSIKVLSLKTN